MYYLWPGLSFHIAFEKFVERGSCYLRKDVLKKPKKNFLIRLERNKQNHEPLLLPYIYFSQVIDLSNICTFQYSVFSKGRVLFITEIYIPRHLSIYQLFRMLETFGNISLHNLAFVLYVTETDSQCCFVRYCVSYLLLCEKRYFQ